MRFPDPEQTVLRGKWRITHHEGDFYCPESRQAGRIQTRKIARLFMEDGYGNHYMADHNGAGKSAVYLPWSLCLETEKANVVLVGKYSRGIRDIRYICI